MQKVEVYVECMCYHDAVSRWYGFQEDIANVSNRVNLCGKEKSYSMFIPLLSFIRWIKWFGRWAMSDDLDSQRGKAGQQL